MRQAIESYFVAGGEIAPVEVVVRDVAVVKEARHASHTCKRVCRSEMAEKPPIGG